MSNIKVELCPWADNQDTLQDIRKQVFVVEQNVSEELEWDGKDEEATHFIAFIDDTAVACARIIDGCYIGRMAVMAPYRNLGLGAALIKKIRDYAEQKHLPVLKLSAQCHAFNFYRKNDFLATSKPYEDAGIPHIDMQCKVFSETDSLLPLYELGVDKVTHESEDFLSSKGYLDILLSQCQRSITICLKDLHHPFCNDAYLIDQIKKLSKQKRYFNVHILLNFYHPSYNEHSLFRLQSRLPSFVEIKLTDESLTTQWVIDGKARFTYDHDSSRVNYNEQAEIKHFMERFKKWWHNAKYIQEARRLSI